MTGRILTLWLAGLLIISDIYCLIPYFRILCVGYLSLNWFEELFGQFTGSVWWWWRKDWSYLRHKEYVSVLVCVENVTRIFLICPKPFASLQGSNLGKTFTGPLVQLFRKISGPKICLLDQRLNLWKIQTNSQKRLKRMWTRLNKISSLWGSCLELV